jgi:hypothetical protein
MPVTDTELATLRALLVGDFESHEHMRGELDDSSWPGYLAFVALASSHSDEAADSLDPNHAERLIHAVLGTGNIDDFDDKTRFATEMGVLIAVIMDMRPIEADLEEFLANARTLVSCA